MMNGSEYRPTLKCGHCGANIEPDAKECDNCGGSFNIDERNQRFVEFNDNDTILRLNEMIPDGNAITNGKGGIGWTVCNHRFSMGAEIENPLTTGAILKALSVLQMEGGRADLMIVNPVQMYEVMQMGGFVDTVKIALPPEFYGPIIGYLFGVAILPNKIQPAGDVLLMDTNQFKEREPNDIGPEDRDVLVLLKNGVTSLG